MPGPGERIGDAYIRVHASGEDIGDDIAAEFRAANKPIGKVGEEAGKEYDEGMRTGLRKNRDLPIKEIRASLLRISRQVKTLGHEAGTNYFKEIEKGIQATQNDSLIADRMARDLRNQFIKSGGKYKVVESIFDSPDAYAQLFERSSTAVRRMLDDAYKQNQEFDRRLASLRLQRENAVRLSAQRQAVYWDQTWNEALRDNQRFNRELEKGLRQTDAAFRRSEGIQIFNDRIVRLGDNTSRIFGRGSRSEFLNVIGRTVGLVFTLGALLARTTGALFDLGRSFTFAFQEGARGFGVITQGFAQMGLSAAALTPIILSLGAAFAVLALVVPAIVSALSLLAGIFTALAGSAFFAVVAGIGSLAAIALPAAGALGVLGLAFIGMDDKAKAFLKNTLRPLGAEFKTLGAAAREGLFSRLPETVDRLKGSFSGLRPLVKEVGIAIADVGFGFAKAMDSPGFREFRDAMTTFLPGAVRKLGEIFRQTLGGFGGIFRGMIPFMDDVLDKLHVLTADFQTWANSPRGQNEIADFFERAGQSAKAAGGFVKELGGLILDLFTAGQDTGDDIFTKMRDQIREWRDALKEDPDILKRWFRDAEAFGDALGDAVLAMGDLLDEMDSASSRENVTSFFENLATVVENLAGAFDDLSTAMAEPGKELEDTKRRLGEIADFFEGIDKAVNDFGRSFREGIGPYFLATINNIKQAFGDLAGFIANVGANMLTPVIASLRFLSKIPGPQQDFFKGLLADAERAQTGLRNTAKEMQRLGEKKPKPQINTSSLEDARRKGVDVGRSLNDVGDFKGKPRMDDGDIAKTGRTARSTDTAIEGIPKNPKVKLSESGFDKVIRLANKAADAIRNVRSKTVYIDTVYRRGGVPANPGASAVGGIFGGLGEKWAPQFPPMQTGGFANFAQNRLIGESGREAVVPLDRPLSLVDPSVRALAAFAQGLNQNGPGSTVGVDASGWTIVSNSDDPAAVAQKVLDRLTAASY